MLHENLIAKTFITNLELCTVLLEDEKHYPWLILVPRRENVKGLVDLEFEDQILLLKELKKAQNTLKQLFKPDNFNIAAIGNKTPQLHVHVIARYYTDPAWPLTVWDHPARTQYTPCEKSVVVTRVQQLLSS